MSSIRSRTREFESHRERLLGLAYRMTGSTASAQDLVQETYLRWLECDLSKIRRPGAWLAAICSRLALNELRARRKRRAGYVGVWLPEPYAHSAIDSPATQAELDESISIGLMLAMERLSPAERCAYLLHDVFHLPFGEISKVLERPAATCRQLAARGRAKLRRKETRFEASPEEHRALLDAFFAAARAGDVRRLTALLASRAMLAADGGGLAPASPVVLRGAPRIARFMAGVWRAIRERRVATRLRRSWLNGAPALLLYENGRLATACGIAVSAGRIAAVYAQRNPHKLSQMLRGARRRPSKHR